MQQFTFQPGAAEVEIAAGALGIEDRLYYSPIVDRPVLRWPNDARVALWISPNVMFYEYLPPTSKFADPWPRSPHPDVQSYGRQDYGNRVAFWRMAEVLDKHNVRCTVSLNVAVLEHFPELRDAMRAREWGYMAHGIYNTQFLFGYSEDEERAYYRDTLATLRQYTGRDTKGALGPGPQSGTPNTPDLLAEAGLLYHADWFHDDQPFPLRVRAGKLISLPYTMEISDASVFRSAYEADEFAEMIKRQFDQLYAEGAKSGRVMCINLHPYVIGQPQRIKYLDEALAYVLGHDQVWQATGDEIAEYYVAHYYDQVLAYVTRDGAAAPSRI